MLEDVNTEQHLVCTSVPCQKMVCVCVCVRCLLASFYVCTCEKDRAIWCMWEQNMEQYTALNHCEGAMLLRKADTEAWT